MKNKLIISVAGIRGVYPEPLSPEKVYRFGLAFGFYSGRKKIFVARDTRKSGTALKLALMAGLSAAGRDIIDIDIASTPQLTYLVEKNGGACGVIISASHNPEEYNGLKFVSSKGTFLNEKEGREFLDIFSNPGMYVMPCKTGNLVAGKQEYYRQMYFEGIYKKVNVADIRKKKFKVIADVCQGVGAFYTRSFLEYLGCEAVIINREPLGVFSHNPEPLAANLKELSMAAVKEKADIGFAQDPDADRLAIVDEKGNIPGEELTLALAVQSVLERTAGPVVVNLSTSALIEHIAEKNSSRVYRTRIGEVNVVEGMKKKRAVIGGEGNGGVILPDVHYGRDSFVGMALILEYIARKGQPVSEIISEFPEYTMLKEKFVMGGRKADAIKVLTKTYSGKEELNLQDGMKIIRKDGWIHIRPSGTEPVLRVYVEGRSKTIARKYLAEITGLIR